LAAKIGLGVSVPTALAIGIMAGFLLFRRHKKQGNTADATSPVPYAPYPPTELQEQRKHHEAGYYTPRPHEAPLMSPVELGHLGDPYDAHQGRQIEGAVNKDNGQVRYEM
jgi:hypothetical protein